MILAAGMGTRLRPLTDDIPKALLPVANRPQIEYVLELLRVAGVREVVINLHHFADRIRDALGTNYRGEVSITYSFEEEILGTGGGVKKVEDFFNDDPFLLINADTLMDVDIREAVRYHMEKGAVATMVVREWDLLGGFGRVEMDGEGRIRRILDKGGAGGEKPVIFTGLHLLSRKIFTFIPKFGYSCINSDCYGAMLENGERVYGFEMDGYWKDTGTIMSYFKANMDFLRGAMPSHCRGLLDSEEREAGYLAADNAKVIQPVLIGRGCRLKEGSRVGPGVVLGDGCRVGSGARVERVVALPQSSFAPNETFREGIRTRRATVVVE